MKDKDIYGSVQEDGSIIHFIYESDGRLINSAQIAGNIENKRGTGAVRDGGRFWQACTQHRCICGNR